MNTKEIMNIIQDAFSDNIRVTSYDGSGEIDGWDDFMKEVSQKIENYITNAESK